MMKVDPALIDAAREFVKPGYVVWDIGANVGLFSFASAGVSGPSGKIVAVEADTWTVGILRRSSLTAWPGRAPVDVVPAAASNEVAIAQFEIANRARSNNYLVGHGLSQSGGGRHVQQVITVTLDWLLFQCGEPQVVKVDVEGAETLVFEGSSELLSRVRPIILCEVAEHNADDVTRILRSHNYSLFDMDIPKEKRMIIERAVWNTVAVPNS